MRWIMVVAAAAWLGAAGAAQAADCAMATGPAGHVVELSAPLDEPARLGLAESLLYGLFDPTNNWPLDDIKKDPGCPIARFTARDSSYTMSGGQGRLPPRWAVSPTEGWVAYLAVAPSIEESYGYYRAGTPASIRVKTPLWVLLVTNERMRHVVRLYDGLPDALTLQADMAAALNQRLPLIADYDADSRAVSFLVPVQSSAKALLWPPLPGHGGGAARITAPDGELFFGDALGAWVMAASGFRCPPVFGSLERMDMWVANATKQRRDLSCRYVGKDAWISIFVTRMPARPEPKSVFERYLREGQTANPPSSAAILPVGVEASQRPAFGQAWSDANGVNQAVWLVQAADWYVQVRATYLKSRATDVGAAVGGVLSGVEHDMADDGARRQGRD